MKATSQLIVQKKIWKSKAGKLVTAIILALQVVQAFANPELIVNGSFAYGTAGWTFSGNFQADSRFSVCKVCPGYAYLADANGNPANNLIGWMYQTVTIPANATSATLSFWHRPTTSQSGSSPTDVLNVTIQTPTGVFLDTVAVLSNLSARSAYDERTFDLTSRRGQTIRIHFLASTDASGPTTFRVDEVGLQYTVSPSATTTPATEVTTTSARLNGVVNPNGVDTSFYFEYGLTTAYGSFTEPSAAISGSVGVAVDRIITALTPDTVYHYRLVAVNSHGDRANGDDLTFRTTSLPPPVFLVDAFVIPAADGLNHGAMAPSGIIYPVAQGSSITFNAAPDTGFAVDHWIVNGNSAQVGGGSYTLSDIRANYAVSVQFTELRYRVEASAGPGGTVSPSGSQTVAANGSISFVATPDESHTVNEWLIGGMVVQTGGITFTLNPVTKDSDVQVTFKLKTYTLNIISAGGSVMREPDLPVYPHGASVRLRAVATAGYFFSQWQGDANGFRDEIRIDVYGNQVITALYLVLAEPINIHVANSTPPVAGAMPMLAFPADDGYKYVIFTSDDNEFWRPVIVKTGTTGGQLTHEMEIHSKPQQYYKVLRFPNYSTTPFLHFPLKMDSSNTRPISSILDHHLYQSDGTPISKDGAILTYKGQLATIKEQAWGYRTKDSPLEKCSPDPGSPDYFKNFLIVNYAAYDRADFMLAFNYDDGETTITAGRKGLLSYDGHSGYDYPATLQDEVVAAATGKLVPDKCSPADGQLAVEHPNDYRTFYIHLSRWNPTVADAVAARDANFRVSAGDVLGYAGNTGNATGVHLHFEVQRYDNETKKWVLADPYGYFAADGCIIDPVLWLSGQ